MIVYTYIACLVFTRPDVSTFTVVAVTASFLVLYIHLSNTVRWLRSRLDIAVCASVTAIYKLHILKSELLFSALDKREWLVGFMPWPIYLPHSTRWIQRWVGPRPDVNPVEKKISAPSDGVQLLGCCLWPNYPSF
jgi:cell division protein FtsW (lipid II flippase)